MRVPFFFLPSFRVLILGDLKSGVLLHFVYLPNGVLHFIHYSSFKQMGETNITQFDGVVAKCYC